MGGVGTLAQRVLPTGEVVASGDPPSGLAHVCLHFMSCTLSPAVACWVTHTAPLLQ